MSDEPASTADPEAEPGSDLIGSVLAGRYRIDALLGSGGMGAVYRAEHIHMRKAVAVKVLHREMTAFAEVVARFEREAVAAGRIEHPNVVTARDFGRLEDGSFYLVLEYVEGKSLASVIDDGGPMPVERALRIARQIAEALGAAHLAGIVHRDLKPDNVMLVNRENYPDFVKVLDFGIAKVKMEDSSGNTQHLTKMGTVFGTPEYMSPEQARGNPVDARSDLYTLGVILYEMLSGKTPFKSDDLVVTLTRHITEPPPALPETVPEQVRELVMRLLQKQPEQRYADAAELGSHFDQLLGFSPAPPSSLALSARGSGGSAPGVALGPDSGPAAGATDAGASGSEAKAQSKVLPRWSPANLRRQATAMSLRLGLTQHFQNQLRPLMLRPMAVGRFVFPLWALFGTAFVIVVLGALGTYHFAGSTPATTASGVLSVLPPSADASARAMAELVKRAEQGDRGALTELGAKPVSLRSLEEWRALGHGLCSLGELDDCIAKYRDGVTKRPGLAKDALVLADVRKAAESPQAFREALELAALHLWAPGVDIVYDVWASTKSDQAKADVNKRAKEFVDDGAVRAKASPALKAALELQRVVKKQDCVSAKKAVKQAVDSGDVRAVPMLEQLRVTRGCGLLGLYDCFSCLRGSVDLGAAIAALKDRAAPRFDAPG